MSLLISHSQSLYELRTLNDTNLFDYCDDFTIELFSKDLKSVKFLSQFAT